jgi:hypothetical protein
VCVCVCVCVLGVCVCGCVCVCVCEETAPTLLTVFPCELKIVFKGCFSLVKETLGRLELID